MIESVTQKDYFQFKDLSAEEKERRGILGRLYGPCADLIHDTRNGRHYSDKLWEKVFQDSIIQEMFKNGGIPGEMDHPTDRSDIDSSKIAIMMPEAPRKDKDGKLIAYFDIIDTPCGKIAYQLAKYGFKWGISSRGEGDVIEGWNGEQDVDPETYEFKCFDLVGLPAVKEARLSLVESLNTNKPLKKSLKEALKKATPADRKIMEEVLKKLNIDVKEKNQSANVSAAENVGADVIKGLQESLKQNKALQDQIKLLQEKLSVCYAKEAKLVEEAMTHKSTAENLKLESDNAKAEVVSLKEQLTQRSSLVEKQERKIAVLLGRLETQNQKHQSLNESMQKNAEDVRVLSECLENEKAKSKKEIAALRENLEDAKQNSTLIQQNYDKKLQKAEFLIEHYRKVALTASDKYIEAKAKMLGVRSAEIKSRLNEGYSFKDIDRVCDSLMDYKLNINSLPFDISKKGNTKISVKESYEPISPKNMFDDEVDDQLISLAQKQKN